MIQGAAIRRLAQNTVWSFVASLLARTSNVILFVLVSRLAGPAEAGILTIGFAYLAITGRFAAWGLDQIFIRDVAQDTTQARHYFVNFGLLRLLVASISALVFGALIGFGSYPVADTQAIWLLLVNVWPEGILNLSQAVFIAHERMSYVAFFGAIVGGSKLALGLLALFGGCGLSGLLWAILLANILAALVSVIFVIKALGLQHSTIDLSFCKQHLIKAAPFVLIAGSYILDNQADTVLLSFQMSKDAVGWYGASTALLIGISLLPQAYRDAVLPTLSRAFVSGIATLDYVYQRSMKYMVISAVPVTFGLMSLSEPVMTLIYGRSFAAAAPALQVLSIAVGMQFVMVLQNRLLVIANQQRLLSIYILLGLIFNVVGNLLFVPYMGIAGAAIARVCSNLLVYILSYDLIKRTVHPFHMGTIWVRPVFAAVVMTATIWYVPHWPVISRIVVGAIVYFVLLLLLRTFSKEEIAAWSRILIFKQKRNHSP